MILAYDTTRYPLRAMAEAHCGGPLVLLHTRGPQYAPLEPGREDATCFHAWLRALTAPGHDFSSLLHVLVATYVAVLHPEGFAVTAMPAWRWHVHLPGNSALPAFASSLAPEKALRWWLPLGDATGTGTLWLGEHPGDRGCTQQPVRYGELLAFHPSRLHGMVANREGHTVVSLSFDTLPLAVDVPAGMVPFVA